MKENLMVFSERKNLIPCKLVLVVFLFVFIFPEIGTLFSMEKFYNYYENGLAYMEKKDWNRAIEEFKSAISMEFADDVADADLMISVNAFTEKGSKIYNMCSAFADVTISVLDMTSGNEIYKNSINKIKGIDIDFEKAGLKALNNSAKKIVEEILPILKNKI